MGALKDKVPILLVLNKKDLIKPGEIAKRLEVTLVNFSWFRKTKAINVGVRMNCDGWNVYFSSFYCCVWLHGLKLSYATVVWEIHNSWWDHTCERKIWTWSGWCQGLDPLKTSLGTGLLSQGTNANDDAIKTCFDVWSDISCFVLLIFFILFYWLCSLFPQVKGSIIYFWLFSN